MPNLKTLMVLLLTGCVLLAFANPAAALFGSKFEEELETEKAAVKLVRDTKRGGYELVDTATLKQWIDNGKEMLIIDTMPFEASYAKQHVPGAEQFLFPKGDMPQWDSEQTAGKTKQDFQQLLGPDKDKLIVVYCGFVKCARSHSGANWAVKLGYTNVYRYPGGIFAWKGADFPVGSVE